MYSKDTVAKCLPVSMICEAIADNRMKLAVQGIYAISNPQEALYSECLIRLSESDGGIRTANEFVPALEDQGLTPLLDRHVLKLILDCLENDPGIKLGCNISAENLHDKTNWGAIIDLVRSRSHLASRLVFELTESRILPEYAFAASMLAEVRRFGCRLALDDFGIGFSTPQLAQMIEFDIIKIDKAFLHEARQSHDGVYSIQHFSEFASHFAQVVVIEGVETKEHEDIASLTGATHFQGNFLSPPKLCL